MSDTHSPPSQRSARKAIGGGLWTFGERGISQAAQLTIFIVAARVLSPAEFGVFALVSACAILLLRFAEVGWAQYIMSWEGDWTVPRQVLFIAIVAGLLTGCLGVAIGFVLPLLGISGVDARIGHLLALFSIWVAIAAASAAQKGMLIRQDKLRASSICEISGEVAGLIVAIYLLYEGWSVFALVAGRLTYQTIHLTLSFFFTRLSPLMGLHGDQMRDLITYSWQVFSGRMIINLRLYVGTFIIGGFLGPAAVGYYRAGERLVGAVAEILGVPTQVLAWSLFRQTRDEHGGTAGFQAQANIFFKVLFATALPIMIWMAVMAEEIITALLGAQWLPALPVVAILAFSRAMMLPGYAVEAILSLAGEIKRLPWFAVCFLVITALAAVATAPYGILAVAWGQVIVALVIAFATFWMFQAYAGINWRELLYGIRTLVIPIAVGTVLLIVLHEAPFLSGLPPLVLAFVAGAPTLIVYAVLVVAIDPQLRAIAMGRLRRGKANA